MKNSKRFIRAAVCVATAVFVLLAAGGAHAKPSLIGSFSVGSGMTPKYVALTETTASNTLYITNTASTSIDIVPIGSSGWPYQINGGTSSPWGVDVYDNGVSSKVYITNVNHGTVSVLNATTNTEITGAGYPIAVGGSPKGIGVNSVTNKIYVANNQTNTVSVINGTTDTVSKTLAGFGAPYGVAVNSVTNKIYVTNNSAGTVRVIDGSTDSLGTTITVSSDLLGIAVDETANKIYVVAGTPKMVYVIDGTTDTVTSSFSVSGAGAPESVDVTPESGLVYVTKPTTGVLRVFQSKPSYTEVSSGSPLNISAGAWGLVTMKNATGSPWSVIIASGTSNNVDYVQETDTYAPVFNGLVSATDGATSMAQGGPSAVLYWDQAWDATGPVTYNVYKSSSSGGENYSTTPYYSTTSYGTVTVTTGGLAYGTRTYFVVRAQDASASATADTNTTEKYAYLTDGAAPSGGGVLTGATNVGTGGAVTLTWTAASDDSPPITYNVYMGYTATGTSFYYATTSTTGATFYGLTNNQIHYFIVRAKDAAGLESTNSTTFSTTPTDITSPTFAGLTGAADASTGGTIALSWSAATDASGPITYLIYASTGATVSYSTPAYTTTGLNYNITGLTNGTRYAFAVRARDYYSNTDSNVVVLYATPTDTIEPTFSGISTCVDLGTSGNLRLTWNAATDNSTPVSYNIYQATASGSQNFASWDYQTSATTGYAVTGLTNGTRYYYVIRAEDSAASTNEDTNVVQLSCVPSDGAAPVFGGITSATPTAFTGEIKISWATATDSSAPIYYNIYRASSVGGENFSSWTYQTSGTTTYTASGLADGSRYYFVVRAADPAGLESTNTTELSAIPNDGTSPVFAGITGATDTKYSGQVRLSWAAAADPATPITYEGFIATSSGGQTFGTPSFTTTSTGATVSYLANNIPYYFVIRARDAGGVTDTNLVQLTATPTDQATPTFTGISSAVDKQYGGEVTLNWSAASDPSTPVTYYIFQRIPPATFDYNTPATTTQYYPVSITGLIDNTTYAYSVGVIDSASPTANIATNTVELSVTPTDRLAPTFSGISSAVDARTNGEIYAYWNAATDRTGVAYYNIYVATTTTNFWSTPTTTATGTATSTLLSGLKNGSYYYIGVRAVDSSSYSNKDANTVWKTAIPTDTTAPTFAGITGATDTTLGSQVTLSWAAATDPSTPITYNIYYAIGSTPSYVTPSTTTQNSTGVTLTGLTNDSLYYFTVRAKDTSGNESTNTTTLTATPTDVLTPTFAGISSATDTKAGGELSISWTAATDNSLPITYYIYQATASGAQNFSSATFTSTQTAYTIANLTDGTTYYYVVRARDASSTGNEDTNTVQLSVTPTDDTAPTFSGLKNAQSATTGSAVTLTWDAASDRTPPIVYNVYSANSPGAENYASIATTTTATSVTITGLTNGLWYYYVVRASDSAAIPNEDTNTTEKQVKPADTLGPSDPTGVSAVPGDVTTTAGDEFASITWTIPTTNMDDTPLTDLGGFYVYRGTSNGIYPTLVNNIDGIDNDGDGLTDSADTYGDLIPATATNYVDNANIVSGTTYYYVVTAVDTANPRNQSPYSNESYCTPKNADDKTPSAPDNLIATPHEGYVTLIWDNTITNTDGSPITDLQGYKVWRSDISTGNFSVISTSTIVTRTYTDYMVTNGNTYYYRITAIDSGTPPRESDPSNTASAKPDLASNVVPASPTGLQITSASGTAYLNWTAPTKNADNTPLTDLAGYNIYRATSSQGVFSKINSSMATQPLYTDTGLTNGTTYYYYVTALDTSNNESASSSTAFALFGEKGIQGSVLFRDSSGPLVQSTGYPLTGIQSVTVNLCSQAGTVLATGSTDGSGSYKIVYDAAATGTKYIVRAVMPASAGYFLETGSISAGYGFRNIDTAVSISTGFTTVKNIVFAFGTGAGDTNCDGYVNLADFMAFKKAFNTQQGATLYDKKYDVDGNTYINLFDFTILKSNVSKPGGTANPAYCTP